MTSESVSDGIARGNVLAVEVGEFLIELAIALQKHAIYPPGHPALGRIAARLLDRVRALLAQRPSFSLGVARTQLVIEGLATDASHPVLRQLALRFHGHHIAALRFDRGVEEAELTELLLSLAPDPTAGRVEPVGLGERLPSWPHIRMATLGLGDLEIVEARGADGAFVSRLWLDLARAALAGERSDAGDGDLSPSVVARVIDRRSGTGTYDQVIAGYLIEITRSVGSRDAAEAALLTERVGRLVRELSPETLRRLMSHGGDPTQQRAFIHAAASGLPVDSVIRLLTATADAARRPLSEFLLRMYEKMAMHAAGDAPEAAVRATDELRTHVHALVDGWTLPSPNPDGYARALAAMARAPAAGAGEAEVAEPEPDRILAMCLELDTAGPVLERAVDRLVADGRAGAALDRAEAAGARAGAAALRSLARLDRLPHLLGEAGIEAARLVPLAERMGAAGLNALLDALLHSEDSGVRRRALDLLAALGPAVAPAVDARLAGETRWFALRNLLALHDALGTAPAADLGALAAHGDGRVRREALKLLLRDPQRSGGALLRILDDADPKVVQLARSAREVAVPEAAVAPLRRRIEDPTLSEPLRLALVRMLGRNGAVSARDALLGLAVRGRTLLGRPRFEPVTAIGLAVLETLAVAWSGDPAAASLLERARAARDPAVRAAAGAGRSP